MTQSKKKCIGCGIYCVRQLENQHQKYCKRCYDIKFHNKMISSNNTEDNIIETLQQINPSKALVFMIVDVLDIKSTLITQFLNQPNVIILINKIDLLLKNNKIDTIQNNVDKLIQSYCNNKFILITTATNYNFIKVINEIRTATKANKKIIFIGKSNVGKSSIIKKICQLNDVKCDIVTSYYLNTTQDYLKVKLNKTTLIDTPGFINTNSILNLIDYENYKKVHIEKASNNKIYQVKYSISLRIENLCRIDIIPNNSSATFKLLINSSLNIIKSKIKDNLELKPIANYVQFKNTEVLKENLFDNLNNHSNLTIPGLCLISSKDIKTIKIVTSDKITPSVLNKIIF